MCADIQTSELQHWGIKGMKWGVRRYQNPDGSLTPAGKKRYDDSSDKRDKVTRYDKHYAKYKTLGYSDEEAARFAKGKAVSEKTLLAVGAAAAAGVTAYAGYRYWDNNKDRFISPNKVLQTVHGDDAENRLKPGNPFYATYGKKDNTVYTSKVFSHFSDQSKITRFYTKDGIKVASEKTGRKVFEDLVANNPEVEAYAKRFGPTKDAKKAYLKFNYSLVLRNDSDTAKRMGLGDLDHDKVHNIFYNELRKRGYGGIIDTNDSKREGFTFNPVIIFDNQIKHVVSSTKATKEHLSEERMQKGLKYAKQRAATLRPWENSTVAFTGGYYLASVGVIAYDNHKIGRQIKFVERYKKEHPNTNLTNAEIASMYKTMNKRRS